MKVRKKGSRRLTSNDFISHFSESHERGISLYQEELKLKRNKRLIDRHKNSTGTADSASSIPAYSAAEFSHVRNLKKHEWETYM